MNLHDSWSRCIRSTLLQATLRDEVPGVLDPVWAMGTKASNSLRDSFPQRLAEIQATTDMKKVTREHATEEESKILAEAERKQRLREFKQIAARPDVRAREVFLAHARPQVPEIRVLAKGSHILVVCLMRGVKKLHDRNNVRIFPLIGTLRMNDASVNLVILAPAIPSDWSRVVDADGVYFIQGSPSNLDDLKRANFNRARSIIVFQGGGGGADASVEDEDHADADKVGQGRGGPR